MFTYRTPLKVKFLSLTVLTAFVSPLLSTASCLEDYKRVKGSSLTHRKFHREQRDEEQLYRMEQFTAKAFIEPLEVGANLYSATKRAPGVAGILPLIGTVVVPVVIAPFTTLTAIGGGVVTAGVAAKKAIHHKAIPKQVREDIKVIQLMENLDAAKFSLDQGGDPYAEYWGERLQKLLNHSVVQNEYTNNTDAIKDLVKAYRRGFFCPKTGEGHLLSLMSYQQILGSIKNGKLKEFIR